MIQPDDRFRLEDMAENARDAIAWLGDLSAPDFEADRKTQMAVIRAVQIVGEAASKISPAFREAHPDLPWKGAIATRNILVHAYRQIRLDILASTIRDDFPPLIAELDRILRTAE